MSSFRTSRVFDFFFIAILASGLFVGFQNKEAITDWFYFITYQPRPEIVSLADDAGLSQYGRNLLYRTNPQTTSKDEIAKHCDIEDLGCITPSGEAYILATEAHDGVVVTGAHEMLHLAYRRLPKGQKEALMPLLQQAIEQINSSFLQQELASQKDEDGRLDEAHSLLGTEYPDLPAALETYYKQYFLDRSKVLDANARSNR